MKRRFLSRVSSIFNFYYCPLVWYFSSANSSQKIEKIQECALRFLHNDQLSSYGVLLSKSKRCTMHVFRLKFPCIEIFNTLNKLYPSFMQDIFQVKSSSYSLRETNNLQHYKPNQVTFGSNSLRSLGPHVWNGLPNGMKSAKSKYLLKYAKISGRVLAVNAVHVNMQIEIKSILFLIYDYLVIDLD